MCFKDIYCNCSVYHVHTGGIAVKIKTEADSNEMIDSPHDDKPSSGMFGLLVLYSQVPALITCHAT